MIDLLCENFEKFPVSMTFAMHIGKVPHSGFCDLNKLFETGQQFFSLHTLHIWDIQ